MKKTLLIAINSKFIHTNLAVRYIKKYVEKYSEENIEIYEANINKHITDVIRDIFESKADHLIFSTYIWNKEYVFKLIKEIKKVLPEVKITLGGPEVSYDSEKIMEEKPEVDYIVAGEGERSVLELLTKEIDEIKGTYYRKEKKIRFNGVQLAIMDLDEIPFPYTEEELKTNGTKILYYESTRGCPFACSYCMSSIERSVRYFSSERTKKDLKMFLDCGIELIKFVDRTFNLDKNRYMDIWKFLVSVYKEGTTFHFEISGDLFDDEVIEFLETVPKDYFQFEIGVQTSNQETMDVIRRKNDLEKLEKNVNRIKDNIHLHLDLIAGLPYEGYDRFKESFNYVHNMYPEMVQLGFLKVLKGTEIAGQVEKFKYKYLDFPPYEVLSNEFMTYEEVMKLKDVEEILDLYYNSEKFWASLKYVMKNHFKSSFDFYEEMADYYKAKGYFEVAHKQVAIFNFFYEFMKEKGVEDLDIFAEHLKLDFIKMGKPGNYPYWIKSFKNKEKYSLLVETLNFRSQREAYKKSEIERFDYNVLVGEKGVLDLLFVYGDKKVKIQEC